MKQEDPPSLNYPMSHKTVLRDKGACFGAPNLNKFSEKKAVILTAVNLLRVDM